MEEVHPWLRFAGGTLLSGVTAYAVWRIVKSRKTRKIIPKDTVVLHHTERCLHVPSLTPFAIKLETYLRMAKIKYECDQEFRMSSKGKVPWIEYNGEAVADSEFSIQYLNKIFNIDLNGHLTPEERAIGRAFQKLCEEHLYWTVALDRWVYDDTFQAEKYIKIPFFMKGIVKSTIKKKAYEQGMGRHTEAEVKQIMRDDLKAIADFIGTKQFLFGDKPCHFDCCVFGLLAEMKWEYFGGISGQAIEELPILSKYCDRMRDRYWPDWDECNTAGGTKIATK